MAPALGESSFDWRLMRIALFWLDYLHYHTARIRAVFQLAEQEQIEFFPLAVRPAAPEFPVSGYQHLIDGKIRVLTDGARTVDMHSRQAARNLVTALEEINPDAVAIVGYDNRVVLAALGWCRRRHKGAVLMSDSQARDFQRNKWRELLKRGIVSLFDSALVAGKPHTEYMHDLGMPIEQIFTGYDVVDNDYWGAWSARVRSERRSWQERLNLPAKYFMTACRLVPKKNVAGLLRSYARYQRHVQDPWPLVIVGDGPLRAELENLSRSLCVAERVRFMGYLSADEMGPVYALASLFILPSAYSEQWGLVVNEAMASGLPVLVSRVCGCVPDLVIEGVTGYSFDPADEHGLTDHLIQFSLGEVDLSRIGSNAQDYIKAYSPQLFAENLIASAQAAIDHAGQRRIDGWPLPLVLPKFT